MLSKHLSEQHRLLGIAADYESTTALPRYDVPENLVDIGEDIYGRKQKLRRDAARAWQSMCASAREDSIQLLVVSAFRSPDYQVEVIQRQLHEGKEISDILTRVAAPGFSEHHSGRAIDLTTPGYEAVEVEFEESDAFEWLMTNAERFAFQLSYPRGNPLGIAYEPWHWCHKPK